MNQSLGRLPYQFVIEMFFLYTCISLLHIFFINIYEAVLTIVYDVSPRFQELSNYIYTEDCTIVT